MIKKSQNTELKVVDGKLSLNLSWKDDQMLGTVGEKLAYFISVALSDLCIVLDDIAYNIEKYQQSMEYQFFSPYFDTCDLSSMTAEQLTNLFNDIESHLDVCRKDERRRFRYVIRLWEFLHQKGIKQVEFHFDKPLNVSTGDTWIDEIFKVDVERIIDDDRLILFAKTKEY